MRITIWGCRGSLPTPGPRTLRYGGNTTCIEVTQDEGPPVIIDAGSGLRALGQKLAASDVREVFLYVTHAHWDHLLGFPFFVPAYMEDFTIRVRGGPLAKGFMKAYLEHQMNPPFFPVPFEVLGADFDFILGDPHRREVGSCAIDPVRLNHPNGGFGFLLTEGPQSFAFLPDNELDFQHVPSLDIDHFAEALSGVDLLLHDAQYRDDEYDSRKGWGHSKLSSVVELAVAAGVGRLGLFHHDPDRSDEEVDRMVEQCRDLLGEAGAETECFAASEGMVLDV